MGGIIPAFYSFQFTQAVQSGSRVFPAPFPVGQQLLKILTGGGIIIQFQSAGSQPIHDLRHQQLVADEAFELAEIGARGRIISSIELDPSQTEPGPDVRLTYRGTVDNRAVNSRGFICLSRIDRVLSQPHGQGGRIGPVAIFMLNSPEQLMILIRAAGLLIQVQQDSLNARAQQ